MSFDILQHLEAKVIQTVQRMKENREREEKLEQKVVQVIESRELLEKRLSTAQKEWQDMKTDYETQSSAQIAAHEEQRKQGVENMACFKATIGGHESKIKEMAILLVSLKRDNLLLEMRVKDVEDLILFNQTVQQHVDQVTKKKASLEKSLQEMDGIQGFVRELVGDAIEANCFWAMIVDKTADEIGSKDAQIGFVEQKVAQMIAQPKDGTFRQKILEKGFEVDLLKHQVQQRQEEIQGMKGILRSLQVNNKKLGEAFEEVKLVNWTEMRLMAEMFPQIINISQSR